MGEIYTERKERGCDSLQVLSVSIHHGVSNEELDSSVLGKKVRRSEDKSLYKHVYFGDLVLNMMRAWQGAIGVVKSEGMVSPAYITAIPNAQLYPLFMDYCLRRDETIIQMDNLSYGVTDFRKRLYWDSFINVLCCIPSVPEQERITAFFTHLDNTLALLQRRLDKLQKLKQGFLQQMFPQNGENVPRLRFANFRDEWEQRKLGEISKMTFGGGTPQTSKDEYWGGNIPWIQSSDLIEHRVSRVQIRKYITAQGLKNSATKLIPKNSIAIVTRVGVGKLSLIPFEYATSQDFLSLSELNVDKWFGVYLLYEKLQKELKSVQGTSIKGITKNELLEKQIITPLIIGEQTKIGVFLKHLDDTIAIHHIKLDKLQMLKQAYLQKMFI